MLFWIFRAVGRLESLRPSPQTGPKKGGVSGCLTILNKKIFFWIFNSGSDYSIGRLRYIRSIISNMYISYHTFYEVFWLISVCDVL